MNGPVLWNSLPDSIRETEVPLRSRSKHFFLNVLFKKHFNVIFCKSGRLIVTSCFKLSMSFLSSLASVVEFLNQMKKNRRH